MSDTRLVWIAVGRLMLSPPSKLTYHRHHEFDWLRTACGRLYGARDIEGRVHDVRFVALRTDSAELIADPCRICWQHKSFMPEGGA
jgi:hypothetical protein